MKANKQTYNTLTLNTRVGELAANLYLPADTGRTRSPVVIITGAWTTVKEQMPAIYASALSRLGLAALTFDFRGWGKSPSAPKYLEDPARKTQDILAVIDAVSELDEVDGSNIFALGVCASSGYILDASAGNPQVRAAGAIAPWLHNKALVNGIYGGEESVTKLIEVGKQAASSAEPQYIEAASLTNEQALMYKAPYYTEPDRGLIPEYDNLFNLASWQGWLNYDAIAAAPQQDKPVLLVGSEAMALPAGAQEYLAGASDNVSAVWLDDVTQFDFYDVPEHVARASELMTDFFKRQLG